MKRTVIVFSLVLVAAMLLLTGAAALSQTLPRGTLPRGTTPTPVQQQRAQIITEHL